MSSKAEASASGIGFFGLLTIVLIVMKLAEIGVVATWSWWWVLGPLWIPTAAVLCIVVCFGMVALLVSLLK